MSSNKYTVMICIPTKGDSKYLPNFLQAIGKLTYPKDKIRVVIVYGGEFPKIMDEFFHTNGFIYAIYEEPQFINLTRNSLYIADICNYFKKLYGGEDYILMTDSDLSYIQPNLIEELIIVDKDVVAPYIWQEFAMDEFFDTYVFRRDGNTTFNCHTIPFKDSKVPVEFESVGTIFLIKRNVFIEANWENPIPHLQFCKNVRRLGYKVWACPYVRVLHADVRNESHPSIIGYENVLTEEEMKKDDSRI